MNRRGLTLLAAGAVAAVAAATAAGDSAPRPTGRIAFERADGLYVGTIGGTATRIPGTKPGDGDPVFSPDGTMISFDRRELGAAPDAYGDIPRDVYVMQADGTKLRQLTRNPSDDGWAKWSPNGRSLSFYSDRREGGAYVVNVATGAAREVASHGWIPDWFPDGRLLYSDDLDRLVTVTSYGHRRQVLPHQPGDVADVAVSPDGGSIAYGEDQGSALMIVAADGSHPRTLAATGQPEDPAWSPDGAWIVYDVGAADYGDQWAVHPDATGATQINDVPGVCCAAFVPPTAP